MQSRGDAALLRGEYPGPDAGRRRATQPFMASRPAGAPRLQSLRPACRFAELGSLGVMRALCQLAHYHFSSRLHLSSCSFLAHDAGSEAFFERSPSSLASLLSSHCRSTFPDGGSCFAARAATERPRISLPAGTRTIARRSEHSFFGHASLMSRQAFAPWSVLQPLAIRRPSTHLASASSMATMFQSRRVGPARQAICSLSQTEGSRSLTKHCVRATRRRSRRDCFTGRSSGNDAS